MSLKEDTLAVIAANVKRLRGERTYREVADACSFDDWICYPATIQQIESEQHMPNAVVLRRLAQALGVTIDELYVPIRATTKSRRAS